MWKCKLCDTENWDEATSCRKCCYGLSVSEREQIKKAREERIRKERQRDEEIGWVPLQCDKESDAGGMTDEDIYAVIDRYLSKGSPAFMSDWFVGTASDVEYRLFIEHHVDRGNGTWIYRRAETLSVAAEIAAAYEQAGCDGPSMGRSRWKRIDNEYKAANSDGHAHNDQEAGMYVYAFLKDEYTIPDSGKSFNARSDYSDRG